MEWQTIAIIVGLSVLAVMIVISMLARLYRKVGPNEALLVYGRGKTPRVVKGAGSIIWPLVENCRLLSLELMSFDVAPQQDLYTNQGVAVTVEAVAQLKVKSDDVSVKTAAEQFLTKTPPQREGLIRLVMEGHLRGIIGQLTVEQIVKEPEMVGDRMRATCAGDMSKMGLDVISFTIKEVRDKNEYISNMGRPDVARIKRDADVAAAEAERDTAIKRAEAEKQRLIAEAEGHAAAIRVQGEAEADIIFRKGEAEAKAMNIKAEAYQEYNQAAVVDKLITSLPEIVRAMAQPLSNVDKITIVSTGNGTGAGASKITADMTAIAAQVPALFEALSGMSITDLLSKVRLIGDKSPSPELPASDEPPASKAKAA